MKKDKDLKITIIGFGNLAESLFYYLRQFIGEENYRSHINATTADSDLIETKRRKFEISILLGKNLEALQTLHPDIIFFSPPPSVAPKIIQNELLEYFTSLRTENLSLPDIYTFPPVPYAEYYQDILGKDIQVVTILPNDVREIENQRLIGDGITFCVFAAKWKQKSFDRLTRFLSPFGEVFEFTSREILPILSTRVLTTAFVQIVLLTLEKLQQINPSEQCTFTHNYIAQMFQEIFSKHIKATEILSSSEDQSEKDNELRNSLDIIVTAWYEGILRYTDEHNFGREKAEYIVKSMLALILLLATKESLEKLKDLLFISATKGGLLEKSLHYVQENISSLIQSLVVSRNSISNQKIRATLILEVKNACTIVLEHGKRLTQ